ncbi:MAG TPA: alkaline phosphatase family protein [Candidatus Cybelea sp.]|jgi:phospholipase C
MERSRLFGIYAVRFVTAAVTLAVGVSGCNGSAGTAGPPAGVTPAAVLDSGSSSGTPIQHIVLVVQEARTFNNLWGTVKVGKARVGHHVVTVRLKKVDLESKRSLRSDYLAYLKAYDNGKMDGFAYGPNEPAAYEYVNPAQIRPYFAIAADYGSADHMFQTQGSGDFTAHQDLIRGGTEISSSTSIIDDPDASPPWGCPGRPGTQTSLITTSRKYLFKAGPFPCFTYDTLQTRLDPKSISWKYYAPTLQQFGSGAVWNAFLAIQAVADNKTEWDEHISSPETNVLRDIAHGNLPAMSWVIPSGDNSDHAGFARDRGPSWVAKIVNAIGESQYWNSTAIVIVWDDWGGFYDPVPPTLDDQGGAGFRVPMLAVSAYTPQAYVSHTVYGFGSIIRFIEDTFGLKRLGTTDKTSTSIGDMFDFNQSPRPFEKIPSE